MYSEISTFTESTHNLQIHFPKHMVLDAVVLVTDKVYKYLRMTENVGCANTVIRVRTFTHAMDRP